MKNIEIKAEFVDLDSARKVCSKVGSKFKGMLHQVDTYFCVKSGRLKLREITGKGSQLIYYSRPDQLGPKISEYKIFPVENPDDLKEIMDLSLGTWKVVEKHRELYLFQEVRIHLDRVKDLGSYLEFEGVVQSEISKSTTQEKVEMLMAEFNISRNQLISASYSDLISPGLNSVKLKN